MQSTWLQQQCYRFTGLAIAALVGLSPASGLASTLVTFPPTLDANVYFNLQPGTETMLLPFQLGRFTPPAGVFCSATTTRNEICDFRDTQNRDDWHWETILVNTSTATINDLVVSFAFGSVVRQSVELDLGPGSIVLFDFVISDFPETGLWRWSANINSTTFPQNSIRLDTAVREANAEEVTCFDFCHWFFSHEDDHLVKDDETQFRTGDLEFRIDPVPEPSTFLLFASGLVVLAWRWSRKHGGLLALRRTRGAGQQP